VAHYVRENPEDPRSYCGTAIEVAHAALHDDENILNYILDAGRWYAESQRVSPNKGRVLTVDLFKRRGGDLSRRRVASLAVLSGHA
jgi:hypothetical protein